jgi:hypothetical protein
MGHLVDALIDTRAAAYALILIYHHPAVVPADCVFRTHRHAVGMFAVIAFLVHYLPHGMLFIRPVDFKELHVIPRNRGKFRGIGILRTGKKIGRFSRKIIPLLAGNLAGPAAHTFRCIK